MGSLILKYIISSSENKFNDLVRRDNSEELCKFVEFKTISNLIRLYYINIA